MRSIFYVTLVLLLAMACEPNPNHQPAKETLTTNKEGLFDSYNNTNRDIWQKPGLILDLLGDLEGKTIVDIGAGDGFFSYLMAQQAEKVVAVEIRKEITERLAQNTPAAVKDRFEVRLGTPDDPKLKDEEANGVIIVNTYMYMGNRVAYLKLLKDGMADYGKLLICDFKKKMTTVGPPPDIRLPLYQVEKDLQDAGFHITLSDDTSLAYQYIVVAEKLRQLN